MPDSSSERWRASDSVDATPDEVPRVMAAHRVHTLIHGHTHRPAAHALTGDGRRATGRCQTLVLGDKDRQVWAQQVEKQGLAQAPFTP